MVSFILHLISLIHGEEYNVKLFCGLVNTRNAPQLLMAVAACSEMGFKDMCMQYICSNMETMLENQ